MEYRKTNLTMIILFIIIIVLGGIYAYKIYNNEFPNMQKQNIQQNAYIEEDRELSNTVTNKIEETPKNNNLGGEILVPPSMSNSSQNSVEVPSIVNKNQNNKYYYNQLDTYSKIIYDAIEENIYNLRTGNCTINIDYDFSDLLNQSNGQTLLDGYYKDTINALNLDVPDLFYIDFSKMSLNIEQTKSIFGTTYKLYINPGENSNFFAQGFFSKTQVEEIINKLESIRKQLISTASGNDDDRILQVHDWIINYMSYEGTSINKTTIYGALTEKKGVCEAYARTFKYLLDELKIENILAVGVGTNSNGSSEDHMWNYVKLNNKWYAVDVTWDDPIVYGGGTVGYQIAHKYFLVGSEELFKNHTEKCELSANGKTFKFPTLSETNYK